MCQTFCHLFFENRNAVCEEKQVERIFYSKLLVDFTNNYKEMPSNTLDYTWHFK